MTKLILIFSILLFFCHNTFNQTLNKSILLNNSYFSIPNSRFFFENSNEFTIEAWIKLGETEPNPGGYTIIGNCKFLGGPLKYAGYQLKINFDKKLEFIYSNSIIPKLDTITTSFAISSDWNHIALLYMGGLSELYINGRLSGVRILQPLDISATFFPIVDLMVGKSTYNDGDLLNGGLDELKIWNYAKTRDEIKLAAKACKNNDNLSGLIVWFDCNNILQNNFVECKNNSIYNSHVNNTPIIENSIDIPLATFSVNGFGFENLQDAIEFAFNQGIGSVNLNCDSTTKGVILKNNTIINLNSNKLTLEN